MNFKTGWILGAKNYHSGFWTQSLSLVIGSAENKIYCPHSHGSEKEAINCSFKENFVIRDVVCCIDMQTAIDKGYIEKTEEAATIAQFTSENKSRDYYQLRFCPWCGRKGAVPNG